MKESLGERVIRVCITESGRVIRVSMRESGRLIRVKRRESQTLSGLNVGRVKRYQG